MSLKLDNQMVKAKDQQSFLLIYMKQDNPITGVTFNSMQP